jgi:hypothetical protein
MAKQQIRMGTRQVTARFWDNQDLAELEDSSGFPKLRLTMIGLWATADASGRFEWKPKILAAKIFPVQPQDQINVPAIMELFVEKAFLLKYEVDGKWYGAWPHWAAHNDFRKSDGHYPPPPGFVDPGKPQKPPSKAEAETETEKEVEVKTEAEAEPVTGRQNLSATASAKTNTTRDSLSTVELEQSTATAKPLTPTEKEMLEMIDKLPASSSPLKADDISGPAPRRAFTFKANPEMTDWLARATRADKRKLDAVVSWGQKLSNKEGWKIANWRGNCLTLKMYDAMESQYDHYYDSAGVPEEKRPHYLSGSNAPTPTEIQKDLVEDIPEI